MLRRILGPVLLAAALALGLLTPATANAAIGDLTCTANFQFNFTLPLTGYNHNADVQGSSNFVSCISPNSTYSRFQSGVTTTNADTIATAQPGVPCSLIVTIVGTATIAWQDGETSQLNFTISTDPTDPSKVGISAIITSGPLAGDRITAIPIAAAMNPDCALNGLKYIAAPTAQLLFS